MFKRLFEDFMVWVIKTIASFIGVIILLAIYFHYVATII